ncbi:MAG: hypothetical protein AB7N71_00760, partial [Phycisphaerae bacterium]
MKIEDVIIVKTMSKYLGQGVYSIGEAAKLTEIAPGSARRWFFGRPDSASGSVLSPDYPRVGKEVAISFLDLIDLLVVGRFRDLEIPLQTIRRVYERLQDRLCEDHPFCHHKLFTDGKIIFIEASNSIGDVRLEEAMSGQQAFPKVLKEYLREIDYDPSTQLASRWRISSGVVLDPLRNFGKPTVEAAGISTFVLANAIVANNRNAEMVADLYGVTPGNVISAY